MQTKQNLYNRKRFAVSRLFEGDFCLCYGKAYMGIAGQPLDTFKTRNVKNGAYCKKWYFWRRGDTSRPTEKGLTCYCDGPERNPS